MANFLGRFLDNVSAPHTFQEYYHSTVLCQRQPSFIYFFNFYIVPTYVYSHFLTTFHIFIYLFFNFYIVPVFWCPKQCIDVNEMNRGTYSTTARPPGSDKVFQKGKKVSSLSSSGVDYNEQFLELNERLDALTEVGKKRIEQRDQQEAKKDARPS